MGIILNAKIKSTPLKKDLVEKKLKEGVVYLEGGKIKFKSSIVHKKTINPLIFI